MESWQYLLLLSTTTLVLSSGEVTKNNDEIDLVSFLRNIYHGLLVRVEPFIITRDFEINSLKELRHSEDLTFIQKTERKAVSQVTDAAPRPVVFTKNGPVKGITVDKSYLFYGVPYADPPVGAYRWKPPRSVSPWLGVYDASFPRAACMQACSGPITEECPKMKKSADPSFVLGAAPSLKISMYKQVWLAGSLCLQKVSEDCLYLNIFVPRDVNFSSPLQSLLPVMVWIHGGDFIAGSASKPMHDGRFISNFTHTVVVNVEYRLGAFGFLVSGKDPHTSAAGNYGILDQQAALLWVQRNIAAFGGDPSKAN
ncbi:cholinesterase-like [Leuresthes tenuis]|uniref:cholinesterase-like n=1 Tax=Leuresthes tenuis TaxID=355514 RepID=UPI003B50217C